MKLPELDTEFDIDTSCVAEAVQALQINIHPERECPLYVVDKLVLCVGGWVCVCVCVCVCVNTRGRCVNVLIGSCFFANELLHFAQKQREYVC